MEGKESNTYQLDVILDVLGLCGEGRVRQMGVQRFLHVPHLGLRSLAGERQLVRENLKRETEVGIRRPCRP